MDKSICDMSNVCVTYTYNEATIIGIYSLLVFFAYGHFICNSTAHHDKTTLQEITITSILVRLYSPMGGHIRQRVYIMYDKEGTWKSRRFFIV